MGQLVKHARTRFGEIAYTERGEGPAALFVHGVMLNGYLWRPDEFAQALRAHW
jgi:pimeloyl-ACP methyl ester carboxylesterase